MGKGKSAENVTVDIYFCVLFPMYLRKPMYLCISKCDIIACVVSI